MRTAYLNIGSNLGDRHAHLARAVALIGELARVEMRVSEVVESAPWGYESANGYLNVGVAFATDLSPMDLLTRLQAIEHTLGSGAHRNADGSYRDRTVDIDIVALDEMSLDTPALTLPHPRMHLREFVLRPMAELAPRWRHPRLRLTPEEMLRNITDNSQK